MRFVWAVVAFIIAAVMIGAGIAQRTVFQGPKTETAPISIEQDVPYLLIDGAVLNRLPGAQTLRAQAEGDIFAAYGRTADMEAWLSDAAYASATLDDEGEIRTRIVEPEVVDETTDAAADPAAEGEAAGDAAAETETAEPGRNPAGSDLWLDEFQQSDLLIAPLQLPEGMSVLVAKDGTEPAPAKVSVSWPIESTTPWAGPLIVGGGIVMAIGVLLYILGIRHVRRSRGPRRKGLPLPQTEPIDLSIEGEDKGVISAGAPTRRAVSGRRAFAILPVVAVSALMFTGCTPDAWPQLGPTPTPTPTQTVVVPESQQAPAVTKAQADRILSRVSAAVAEADEALDAKLAATRLDGAVLAERTTNYKLRGAIADRAPLPAIPTKSLEIILPQAFDGWPRTFMAVVSDADDKTANIMMLSQADQWSPYKLNYLANLEASTVLPEMAAHYVGATQVPPDSEFLMLAPQDLAAAYADVIDNGEKSEYWSLFDSENDHFRPGVLEDRQRRLDDFNQTATNTGNLTFKAAPGTVAPVALATLDNGAIVAVHVHEMEEAKPTNADAVIKLGDNTEVKALTGVDQSASGVTTTFSDQVFFYVPVLDSDEKIQLLGYSSNILDAKVIK